jgi:hypothetical protein
LKAILPIDAGNPSNALKIGDQTVSLDINIRRDMMRDPSCRVAETNASVKSNRA